MPFYSTVTSSQVWFVSMISNVVSFIIERDAVFNFLLRTYTHTATHERTSARARDRQLGINSNAIFVCFIYPTVYVFDFIFFNLRSEWIFIFLSFYTWTALWIQLVHQPTRVHSRVATVEWFQTRTSIKNVFPCNVFVAFFSLLEPIQMKWKHNLNANWYRKLIFYIQTSISDEMAMWNIWFVFSPLLSWCYEMFFPFSTPRIGVII